MLTAASSHGALSTGRSSRPSDRRSRAVAGVPITLWSVSTFSDFSVPRTSMSAMGWSFGGISSRSARIGPSIAWASRSFDRVSASVGSPALNSGTSTGSGTWAPSAVRRASIASDGTVGSAAGSVTPASSSAFSKATRPAA